MADSFGAERGRRNLDSSLLRLVDAPRVEFKDLVPGRQLIIHAEDAMSKQPGAFALTVVSTRVGTYPNGQPNRDTTFVYRGGVNGDFFFYHSPNGRSDNITEPIRLWPGTLMENGFSTIFVPQTILYMVLGNGGIEVLGRDHSFEYVDGQDMHVFAHKVTRVVIEEPDPSFQLPDITDYLKAVDVIQEEQRARWEKKR